MKNNLHHPLSKETSWQLRIFIILFEHEKRVQFHQPHKLSNITAETKGYVRNGKVDVLHFKHTVVCLNLGQMYLLNECHCILYKALKKTLPASWVLPKLRSLQIFTNAFFPQDQ